MLRKVQNVKSIVENILFKEPKARDNNHLLIAMVWEYQFPDIFKVNGETMRTFMVSNQLYDAESIRRASQLVRKKYPKLQSSKQIRKKLAEEMRMGINKI